MEEKTKRGKKITLKEACELAKKIMREAEEGRIKAAEEEAKHYKWEDEE